MIVNTIEEVQSKRNMMAHWRMMIFLQTGEIRFRKKREIEKSDMFDLTEKDVEELELKKQIAFEGIVDFHQWTHRKKV